jgi:hypothetical protein
MTEPKHDNAGPHEDLGGESGMSSELGGGLDRDATRKIATSMNPDEGSDMGAGRDPTGKRYMGGTGGESSQEQSERNPGGH